MSSKRAKTVQKTQSEPREVVETPAAPTGAATQPRPGFFVNAANWILSRLPWFRDRYESWSTAKRVWIGLPLYLVALPVIPIIIAIIWYVRDPEGFKRSKAAPIMGAIIVAWFGGFGLLAMQPGQVSTNQTTGANSVNQKDGLSTQSRTQQSKQTAETDTSDSATPDKISESKKKVQSRDSSEPSRGRDFKNCDAAFDAGVFNITRSDPSYQPKLDGDGDGVACEKN